MSLPSTINEIMEAISNFIRVHQNLTAPVCFCLAFAESLAFLSILVPATIILLGVGIIIGEINIPFIPILIATSIGAFCGDWVSYFFGYHFKDRIAHIWPINKTPDLLERGHLFFERWGIIGVFISRFFGPLRAIVPLVAGICSMSLLRFQLINLVSALLWAFLILIPGAAGLPWLINWLH